ncbi:nucleoid occlusion factor SlmA [Thiohalophilus thiocyanatoxydans]|uniref:Nucleoid occlusion factor SlmA n=1 Tax=Thiohalophilus thiocyanatoxydans TaxID=381308 RepID=A0A4R8ISU8_9GAMM|nr:nucleoid occlusion factor SlmA [Thiohalophilus thiocyanatoxydans]TDY04131.1 TetR family transcriptional regulator [Thiohalophilus thiocyanatoxydans]
MAENKTNKPSRRQQILEVLAAELENSPGERITTAGLARAVGVSEAALYRHFPSKARMFEGLIEFIEESIFGLINRILEDQKPALARSEHIMTLVLGFAGKNAGITRLLAGDVLVGETERLRSRIDQFYDRLETQLKQVLREGEMNGELPPDLPVGPSANLLLAVVEGRINQYVRSGFRRVPLEMWEDQWRLLEELLQGRG